MDSLNPAAGASAAVLDLAPDCARCSGLCCVAPAFARSSDFAITKGPGDPCPHLTGGFLCDIHHRLRAEGFPGCAAFDCFGAGRRVTQEVFAGRTWRESPELASQMFDAFAVMRQIHSMLKQLAEALTFQLPPTVAAKLQTKYVELLGQSGQDANALLTLDISSHAKQVDELLAEVSQLVRRSAP